MGGPNKLLAEIGSRPLVPHRPPKRRWLRRAKPVIVVTGHQRDKGRSCV